MKGGEPNILPEMPGIATPRGEEKPAMLQCLIGHAIAAGLVIRFGRLAAAKSTQPLRFIRSIIV
jgi:hypothetical protein